ncbi:MAG: hypothetical protein JXB49_05585 [Bacteroidales bacterium]|nr:hypothetical protein [Bacteroidales bacterium]MBN2818803.1 hypothetical protein [Bacteroidales bacterium]
MRNLILMIAISIIIVCCSKENYSDNTENYSDNTENYSDSSENYSENTGIVIKGNILVSQTKSSKVTEDSSLLLSDAKKILVFNKYYYKLYDIVNGAFSVPGEIGTGVALIFLDTNNKYIGNLSSQGLNMLPLGSLSNGENTTIDLSTLTLVGNSVIPSHDPLGNEIQISETEINCLKVIDGYYEAIAKNIDVDNDGNPDVLSDRHLVIYTMFTINGGHWGYNDLTPIRTDSSHYYVNYMVELGGGSGLTFSDGDISLSGPTEDPYNDIKLWGYMKAPQCGGDRGFISSFCRETNAQPDAPWGSAFLPFKKGTYTLTLDGNRSFTLNYSNIDMEYNLVIVIPTLHTDSAGNLISISFDYELPDGEVINPASILTNVMVQLSNNQGSQFYVNDKNKLTSITGFNELTFDTPLDISSLHQIDLSYDDLLGNQYDIIWR